MIRNLAPSDFNDLHACFLEAFSDYMTKVQPTPDELRYRLRRSGVSYEHSAGFFEGGRMAAFILTAIGQHEGKATAYNAGTGVVPSHRRQGFAVAIYRHLLGQFSKQGLQQAVLEVIDSNEKAIALYESMGMSRNRHLQCFVQALPIVGSAAGLVIAEAAHPNWEAYRGVAKGKPTWQNSYEAIGRTLDHEHAFEAYMDGQLVGFLSVCSHNGYISQLGVRPAYRRKGIGRALLAEAGKRRIAKLGILNVPSGQADLCGFFDRLGFAKAVGQYEMVMAL